MASVTLSETVDAETQEIANDFIDYWDVYGGSIEPAVKDISFRRSFAMRVDGKDDRPAFFATITSFYRLPESDKGIIEVEYTSIDGAYTSYNMAVDTLTGILELVQFEFTARGPVGDTQVPLGVTAYAEYHYDPSSNL